MINIQYFVLLKLLISYIAISARQEYACLSNVVILFENKTDEDSDYQEERGKHGKKSKNNTMAKEQKISG